MGILRSVWPPRVRKQALDLGLYGHTDYARFIVLGRSRVGSNLLRGLLNAHPAIEAYGEIERKQKDAKGNPVFPPIRSTITGVWDTKVVPQNVRKPPVPSGAWVYMRED